MSEYVKVGDPLTPREKQVLRLIVKGRTRTADIAAYLGISEGTAKNHLHNAYTKLDAHNKIEAIIEARARGELEI